MIEPTPAPDVPKAKMPPWLIGLFACGGLFLLLVVVGAIGAAVSPPKANVTVGTGPAPAPPTTPTTTAPAPTTTAPPTTEPPTTVAPTTTEPPTTVAPTTTAPIIGDGTLIVGTDIQPGRYRGNVNGGSCYGVRLSSFSEDAIIENDNVSGPTVVDIAPTDKGFKSSQCGSWAPVSGPVTSGGVPGGDGVFVVGVDVTPGTYRSTGGSSCYWARVSDFSGGGIIDNDNSTGPAVVTIASTDAGFKSSRCGSWTRVR